VEKVWPFADFYWSQESALEFLLINNYKISKTLQMIKDKDENFDKFMKSKILINLI
jgi:hypothetical protein